MNDSQSNRPARAAILTAAGVSYFFAYGVPHGEHQQFPALPALQWELAETSAGSSTTAEYAQARLTVPSSGGGMTVSVPAASVQITAHAPTILVGGVSVGSSGSTERSV